MATPEKHKKPTQAELKKQIEDLEKDLDTPEPSPSAPPQDDPQPSVSPSAPPPSPSPSAPPPSVSPSAPPTSPSPSPASDEKPSPSPEDKEKTRLKEQYKGSSREALVQKAGRESLAKAIETADGLAEPTDEDLKKEYEDWDVMSDTERKLAKKTYINDRRFEIINEANKESKDLDKWLKTVDEYIVDPKVLTEHPELESKEEAFRAFAITPSRRGVPLADLVKIFLFDATKATPSQKRRKMFEQPNGGDGTKGKPRTNKISMADAEKLRETNYDEYKKALRAGRIDQTELTG